MPLNGLSCLHPPLSGPRPVRRPADFIGTVRAIARGKLKPNASATLRDIVNRDHPLQAAMDPAFLPSGAPRRSGGLIELRRQTEVACVLAAQSKTPRIQRTLETALHALDEELQSQIRHWEIKRAAALRIEAPLVADLAASLLGLQSPRATAIKTPPRSTVRFEDLGGSAPRLPAIAPLKHAVQCSETTTWEASPAVLPPWRDGYPSDFEFDAPQERIAQLMQQHARVDAWIKERQRPAFTAA